MSKQNIKLSEPINKTMYRIVYRQFSTVLLRMWRHKMFFFVGFFIYFHKYIAAFELFTPFIMRCEANFKVKTNPKPGALAFSPKSFTRNLVWNRRASVAFVVAFSTRDTGKTFF